MLLERCGLADPGDIADAIRHGTYATLVHAIEGARPETVIEEVRAAGLAGRGGAYLTTAVKWAACRAATGAPKYLVVNGEEGEPGIFKDRHLMEGDPHRLLEAVLLAAYASGASRAILYVHGEAELSAERLRVAVGQAREWGLLGERILGSDLSLDVELRRGAGGFVLGEETALLESIEGYRAMPRTRPPFPVESGLWGKPTVINNVETLCAVPSIVAEGGAWFASLGRGGGTKLFGLSGHVRCPGLVEVELGTTLRTLTAELGGGSSTGRPLRAAVLGGPSGSVVPARQFDEPLVPRGPVSPGTGGVVALDEGASVADAVRTLLAFNMRESCGKCTPCREGTARVLRVLDGPVERERVSSLAEVVQVASLCGLGQAAPLAVLSALAEFPGEVGLSGDADEAHDRRTRGRAPRGRDGPRRREPAHDPAPPALQGPGSGAARRLPDVPRPRRGPARAPRRVPPAGARGHGRLDRAPRRRARAPRRPRPHARDADPVGRARGLWPGRRRGGPPRPARAGLRAPPPLRRRRVQVVLRARPRGVHPLRALHGRVRRGPADRRDRPPRPRSRDQGRRLRRRRAGRLGVYLVRPVRGDVSDGGALPKGRAGADRAPRGDDLPLLRRRLRPRGQCHRGRVERGAEPPSPNRRPARAHDGRRPVEPVESRHPLREGPVRDGLRPRA